jgi:ubiquinone/menaquinone biosynthesis C-methylase UbiE
MTNFDRLAPFYRAMEAISAGGKLQRCRTSFLHEIPTPERILLAGEGHGRFLPECVQKFPQAKIVVVDSSERMLKIARRKVNSVRVNFVRAELPNWNAPHGGFDLIVTNFFLDCFPADDLERVVARLGELASPTADWLLADFEIAPAGPARWRSRIIVSLLYRFFKLAAGLEAGELAVPDSDLEKSGFSRHRRITSEWGLLKSEWWRRG